MHTHKANPQNNGLQSPKPKDHPYQLLDESFSSRSKMGGPRNHDEKKEISQRDAYTSANKIMGTISTKENATQILPQTS